ncbi:MAG: Fic family protein [Holosporaceae bacterium]|jgi:Fic family protein|nr:Fic family protein [Holosporaceae bacterium]
MRITGSYEKLGELNYFIPHKLPPDPPFVMNDEIIQKLTDTAFHLGRLNEMSRRLPNIDRFIKAYVLKEAMLSSEIEGIFTTLADVFTIPINEQHDHDTRLVLNYTKAINTAVSMVKNEGFPIVTRVLLRTHEELMRIDESGKSSPGEFRLQSVRVGDLVPSPAFKVPLLISEWETFVNQDASLHELIKIGLAHVQFETIHPFLDGNGRIGRLLIVLMLINSGYIDAPILYPSYYFKKHQMIYYEKLRNVQLEGDFEGWVKFYLDALKESATDAHNRAKEIEELEKNLRTKIINSEKFSRIREISLLVLSEFFNMPMINIGSLSEITGKSYNTIKKVIDVFQDEGIIIEKTNKQRNKLYCLNKYLKILEK